MPRPPSAAHAVLFLARSFSLPRGPGSPSIIHHRALTHDTSPRLHRRCRCASCGMEDTCTPRTDFNPRVPGGELYCLRCLNKEIPQNVETLA